MFVNEMRHYEYTVIFDDNAALVVEHVVRFTMEKESTSERISLQFQINDRGNELRGVCVSGFPKTIYCEEIK